MTRRLDVVEVTKQLVSFPSTGLESSKVQEYLAELLKLLGFTCTSLPFVNEKGLTTYNLFATRGSGKPHFAFAAHTDVVLPGEENLWQFPPFEPTIKDGYLYGRGVEDMKGGLAASIVAVADFVTHYSSFPGTVSFMITGDEEGDGDGGMPRIVEWMKQRGIAPDACVIPEPASKGVFGGTIKIGSRGCMDILITLHGKSGHTAYPISTVNPIHVLVPVLHTIITTELDQGSSQFEPTNVNVVTFDTGNSQFNSVPGQTKAVINIRFTELHTQVSLRAWVSDLLNSTGLKYDLSSACFNDPYYSEPNVVTHMIQDVVQEQLGTRPVLNTHGGASDARVITQLCPTVEMGMLESTSHKVDERILVVDLYRLQNLYYVLLERFFGC